MVNEDYVAKLAKRLARRREDRLSLIYPSTATGKNTKEVRIQGIPLPVGTVGQVITAVDIGGGVILPKWENSTGGSGSQYRRYVLTNDPNGGSGFVVMDAGGGVPMYDLADLE